MSCQRAQGFLEQHAVAVGSITDASKEKRGPDEALALARQARLIYIARGKNIVTFDMTRAAPADDELLKYLLGPSGNLRAPTIRQGNTLYVGFNEAAYRTLVE